MADNRISPAARIGRDVRIGTQTVVHDNVAIGDGVTIGDFCIIGHPASDELADRTLTLGPGSHVRSHSVVYEGSHFESRLETGHHVLIRERTRAGHNLRVGSFSDIEGDCRIGDYTRLHGYVHVGRGSELGSFVWIAALVTLFNDPLPPSEILRPPVLEDGSVVCGSSSVMPGAIMRRGSFAAAGTLVRGEIPPGAVVEGPDCERRGHVATLVDMESGVRHPWMRHDTVHFPEEARDRIERLGAEILASRFAGDGA